MKRTKEKAAETKELLFNAALQVCSKKGYQGTTLNDIAKEAGVTRGAIHWHFGNKLNLFISIAEKAQKKINEVIEDSIKDDQTPLTSLKIIMQNFFSYVFKNQEFKNIVNIAVRAKMSDDLADLKEVYIEALENRKKFIIDLIKEGMETGEIKKNLNPERTSAAIISFVSGSVNNWIFNAELFPLESGVDDYIDLIITGIKEPNNQ